MINLDDRALKPQERTMPRCEDHCTLPHNEESVGLNYRVALGDIESSRL
jgi:hypothetical protein